MRLIPMMHHIHKLCGQQHIFQSLKKINWSSDKWCTGSVIRPLLQERHRALPWRQLIEPYIQENQALATSNFKRRHQSSQPSSELNNKTYTGTCDKDPLKWHHVPQVWWPLPLTWSNWRNQFSWEDHVSQHFVFRSPVQATLRGPKSDLWRCCQKLVKYLAATTINRLILDPKKTSISEVFVDAYFCVKWHKPTDPKDSRTAKSHKGYPIVYAGCPIIWVSKQQTQIVLIANKAN